ERRLCRDHAESCWARNRRAGFLIKGPRRRLCPPSDGRHALSARCSTPDDVSIRCALQQMTSAKGEATWIDANVVPEGASAATAAVLSPRRIDILPAIR